VNEKQQKEIEEFKVIWGKNMKRNLIKVNLMSDLGGLLGAGWEISYS
jgi:hypothetical protein